MNEQERKAALAALAKEAIDVQDACNLSGVAHGFARAMSKLCELGLDTNARNQHPVAVMWSSKIASLTGSEDSLTFSRAYDACKALAEGKKPHSEVAIYEAQRREDARADTEGRKPRLIKTMEDIVDQEEAIAAAMPGARDARAEAGYDDPDNNDAGPY